MIKRHVYVDFSKKSGRLSPVNCANTGPRFGIDLSLDLTDEYRRMAVPFVRTHNVEPPFGGGRFVDMHNIFPVPELDERFESSYNFAPTDEYFAAIKSCGAGIFLRLGESRFPYEVKPYAKPRVSAEKWAHIAEHIIRHYNSGWARGYKYGIKYVEIMADADSLDAWGGSRVEFFEFYRTVACYLKERFPRLRIGGYSCGGFHSLNHFDPSERSRASIEFLEEFLDHIGSREHRAPLDFLSWHCEAETPEELSLHANYARNYLDQSGFRRAESIVSEFRLERQSEHYTDRSHPAALVSALIIAAKSGISMMFSDADPRDAHCALYSAQDRTGKQLYASYRAMEFFGRLVSLGITAATSEDFRREIYTLAATDGEHGALLLVTREYEGVIELDVKGTAAASYSVRGLIGGGERGCGFVTSADDIAMRAGRIMLRVGKNEVYLITLG